MPYPRSFYYMLVVIGVILIGFWPSYFTAAPTTLPWQFHAHGVAASLWVLMVTAQSWTAQRKTQLDLHRAIGKASLFLFPFLIGGLAAISDRQAKDLLAGEPGNVALGPDFLFATFVAMAAYVIVFYRALKYRRKVWVHAGYMLSTPLILFESPFSRAASFVVPQFKITNLKDFSPLLASIEWSMGLSVAIIAIIWWRVGERAKPFVVTGVLIAIEMVAIGFSAKVPALWRFDAAFGQLPSALIVLTGFAIGAATSWAGWQAGKKPAVPAIGAALPA